MVARDRFPSFTLDSGVGMLHLISVVTMVCCFLFTIDSSAQHTGGHPLHSKLASTHQLIDDVNSGKLSFSAAQKKCGSRLIVLHLSGKVFHFAPNIVPPDAPVAGVLVSIAEFPFTRYLRVTSNTTGTWTMPVIKFRDIPLTLSLLFEKEGFVKTKSNVLTITEKNIDSIAIQCTDVGYYDAAVATLEQQVSEAIGIPYTVQTLAVATVGKSWTSMFVDQFPHGDPGATVVINPPVSFPTLGPIYFNEAVMPDPSQPYTSNDGGVLFANLPEGTFTLNAYKEPFSYSPVTFIVEPGVKLYIASPPHSIQGTNSSGPGEW